MAINHVLYDNYFLSNEVEDLYNSYLDLQQFATVDNSLVGAPGMVRKVNVYGATDNTADLAMGEGNTDSIIVSYTEKEYKIKMAQNRFQYYDEQAMTDPNLIPVGVERMAAGLFNHVNADVFTELNKADAAHTINATSYGFDAFADAVATLNIEGTDNDPAVLAPQVFAIVNPADAAKIRKALKDELKYVEAYVRTGYIGTVAGVNIYVKKDAVANTCVLGTKKGVTIFNKKGVEVETPERSSEDANIRLNTILSRKYYVAAATDLTKLAKIVIGG